MEQYEHIVQETKIHVPLKRSHVINVLRGGFVCETHPNAGYTMKPEKCTVCGGQGLTRYNCAQCSRLVDFTDGDCYTLSDKNLSGMIKCQICGGKHSLTKCGHGMTEDMIHCNHGKTTQHD